MASAEARIASRDSTTRFGSPVEPEVAITSGVGVVGGIPLPEQAEDLLGGAGDGTQAAHASTLAVPDPAPPPSRSPPALPTVATCVQPGNRHPTPARIPAMATPAQWIAGARPRTLPAAVAPVLAGTAVAVWEREAVWWKALLALAVALLLQVGVNYANDYSDGVRGTDDDRVGPLRLVGSKVATPRAVKAAALACLAGAAVVGLVLAATTAWWLVGVGLLCILAAWFYTGGSRPYGYMGLGEVMVFVFFGLVAVLGTTYVQTESFELPALYAAVGVGSLACAILVANNLRDIPTDRVAGKRTLAVALGDERTRHLYGLLVDAAGVALVGVALSTTWWALLALAAGPPLIRAVTTVLGEKATGPALIPVLQQTGIAELLYAAGLFAGLGLVVLVSTL